MEINMKRLKVIEGNLSKIEDLVYSTKLLLTDVKELNKSKKKLMK